MFSLETYARSREEMTGEFARLMPAMVGFVQDWLRAHDSARLHKGELTAKSYFLQEAEGLSRRANESWSGQSGVVAWASPTCSMMVLELPGGMAAEAERLGMSEASAAVLGYEQPVEEKALGAVTCL